MKKQKFMKLSAFTSDPELGNSFSAPATHDGEVSVVFREKNVSIHGWDGSAWTTIYTWNGLDKQFTFENTYQNYFLKSLTGSQETMGVSFFSTSRYQGSTPSLAGIDRDVKFHDVDEVPIYTSSDNGKFLTVRSDGSLAWLGLNESYVVEVIGTGDDGGGGGNVIAGTFLEDISTVIARQPSKISSGIYTDNSHGGSIGMSVLLKDDGVLQYDPNTNETVNDEFTISWWMNLDASQAASNLGLAGIDVGQINGVVRRFAFDLGGGSTLIDPHFISYTRNPKTTNNLNTGVSMAGVWTHVAIVIKNDGSNTVGSIYLNGSKLNNGFSYPLGTKVFPPSTHQEFMFGAGFQSSSVKGQFDSMQIADGTALTDSQVAAIAGQADRQMSIETAAQPSGGGPSSFAEEILDVSSLVGDASLVDDGGNKIFQNFPAGSSTPGYALANWSDYITYNSTSSQFEYTTMAVSFWFKLDSEISSSGQSNGYSIIGDKSSADGFHMFIFNSGTTHELYLGYRKPGNGGATKRIMNTSNGAGNSFVNGWNHALVVFHGDQVTFDLYANGSFVRTVTDADAGSSFIGDVTNQNSQFAIGAKNSSGASARGFLVETDSLEIVQDVTLTEAQVSQIAADSTRQTSINDV